MSSIRSSNLEPPILLQDADSVLLKPELQKGSKGNFVVSKI